MTRFKIPDKMLAVKVDKVGGQLQVDEVSVPVPGNGEVLIKISAAPINPSDLNRINSISENELKDFIPGVEGSGTVVDGKGIVAKLWMGKLVSCSSVQINSGTWAEYMVTSAMHCFPIKNISAEQGSMLIVNPMTALAFIDIAVQEKHKAIINTAAASALGRMLEILAKEKNIPLINIVRKQDQLEALKAKGVKHVLCSTGNNFKEELKVLSHQLQATLLLDAIGGKLTQEMLETLPYGSTSVSYGNLSEEHLDINPRTLITDNKKIIGFYLGNKAKENGILKTLANLQRVKKLLKTECEITIQNRVPLEKAQLAVDTYRNNMTAGKVLLIPGYKG